ncbi:hypothetical protein M9Y10_015817 [Tritrichomonas musculus]|uniref:Protein kinase domain-containing protein n=1 Tax=Tritrichomonas musculus TaxID=1915356 RepID=A0ABR2I5N0_9EUKA
MVKNTFFYVSINFVILNESHDSLIQKICPKNKNSEIYDLVNDSYIVFEVEITNFSKVFQIITKEVQPFWSIIVKVLSGFLIKQGYLHSQIDRMKYYNNIDITTPISDRQINITKEDYVSLRELGHGSGGRVNLIYMIKQEKNYALKIHYNNHTRLIKRERNNFLNLNHLFLFNITVIMKKIERNVFCWNLSKGQH